MLSKAGSPISCSATASSRSSAQRATTRASLRDTPRPMLSVPNRRGGVGGGGVGARKGDAAGKAGSCESDAAGSEEEAADMNDTMNKSTGRRVMTSRVQLLMLQLWDASPCWSCQKVMQDQDRQRHPHPQRLLCVRCCLASRGCVAPRDWTCEWVSRP